MVSEMSRQVEAGIGTMTADGPTDHEVDALSAMEQQIRRRITTEVEVSDDGEANWSTLAEFDKIALHG
jgi:hypothetical protein